MILVSGGAGYIGSHTCVELLAAGYDVLIADNLSNSSRKAVERIGEIAGRTPGFAEVELTDGDAVQRLFWENPDIEAILHFAGLKAVGESAARPLKYYNNNLGCTLSLLRAMRKYNMKNIVFSSSATVYGDPETTPIREDFPLGFATNPYGSSKQMIERILQDCGVADPVFRAVILRYFNPIGAHESGLIGEDPRGIPNNLLPYIAQVAVGKLDELKIFGNDYETPDGTGVRDYIHVTDLAKGHVAALKKLEKNRTSVPKDGCLVYNLGTGKGYSVLEIVEAFSKASGKTIPYRIAPRRAGDIACCYADPSKAKRELGWQAEHGIEKMCADTWNWQKNNPRGYE
ncbi:MAG: UDP-glucose 4-epimerase GalE [Clostridiales Family XIII bacterium]|jgi:UDP-glucose 4-epimerase|nr:UDP-glucose 4-epimerase GalE [Clostridiales Family XIII bacterium]